MNNFYETMYILRPDLNEEAVDEAIGQYQDILKENGADILETQHRGKRRLAYEINRFREGIYIQMNYQAPGAAIAPMERAMRLSEAVIRYLTLVVDEVTEDDDLADSAGADGARFGRGAGSGLRQGRGARADWRGVWRLGVDEPRDWHRRASAFNRA